VPYWWVTAEWDVAKSVDRLTGTNDRSNPFRPLLGGELEQTAEPLATSERLPTNASQLARARGLMGLA